ncbi:DNA polymerase alpha subunit B [Halyomorpha halys]|uniref:DNA polymerase alpha subunit B n=1 Tax=Halyomorpha halys TaxID=286706 RepID=UPI0006D4F047|nr:DNA polymerase alpha subunit B [Halyomorpha halys]
MVTKEEMKSQLSGVGISSTDEILEMCCEFCLRNNIDEVAFVDAWVAFAFSELSSNLSITHEGLQIMERKEFGSKSFSTPKQISRNAAKNSFHQETTPKRKNLLQFHASSPSEGMTFSPSSYSPSVNKEKRESNIPSGQVLLSCGKSSNEWKSNSYCPDVNLFYKIDKNVWKYMYDVLYDIWNLNEDFCEEIANTIVSTNELADPTQFEVSSDDNSLFVGRVSTEEARINSQKVEVQGIGPSCKGKIEVDMSQIPDFSLFPGQVLAFKGFREGKKIIATQLFLSASGPSPEPPKVTNILQIVFAAGPFAGSDLQSCEVFNSIIKYLQEHKPNFFFLIGPILDMTNQQLNISDFAETFENYHQRVLNQISNSLAGLPTKFFFISSPKDIVNLPVYPTPPIFNSTTGPQNAISFLPDPSFINIDGLLIGLTSVDSLLHLSKKEVSNCKGNRLARLAGHLLKQQTFYPLYPSDLDISVDLNLWYKCARIPTIPHILILPSDLHFFVKNVENCLVINPERIVKGCTRGSFAHVEVNPLSDGSSWNVDSHISVKIIKV